jgi:tetratricopeptide (TPR) repeat protein
MGFLRKWYRDNVSNGEERARMLLEDGEYGLAAMEFISCGIYREAADAYMKLAEEATDAATRWDRYHYFDQAAENFEKARDYEEVRKAYERGWRRSEMVNIERLAAHGQLQLFCQNVRNHEPGSLVSDLEHAGELQLAIDMCMAASEIAEDLSDRYLYLRRAVEYAVKADVEEDRLLQLHKDLFKADIENAVQSSHLNIGFPVTKMSWIIESGNLSRFVDDLVDEFPAFLWYSLYEGLNFIENELAEKNSTEISKEMLRCIKTAEANPKSEKDWKFLETENYYSNTAAYFSTQRMFAEAAEMYLKQAKKTPKYKKYHLEDTVKCYRKANQFLKAAEVLEQLGEFKEAAGLAEDAGNIELAIRLYEQALKGDDVRDTEAEWIKMTIERLRKGEDEPSIREKKPQEVTPTEPVQTPTQPEPVTTCPKCGAEVPEGDSFCGVCGHRLTPACSQCGATVKEGNKFCTECGATFG